MRIKQKKWSKYSYLLVIAFAIIALAASCNYPPALRHNVETTNAAQTALIADGDYPVANVFLPFLNSLGADQVLVGKAVSAAYVDPATGNTIQYFQTLRMEENKVRFGDDQVFISPLGDWLSQQANGNEVIIDQDCQQFPESEYLVCAAFRTFYEDHQGTVILGKPISNVYQTGERYFQYFENACLVWDPYKPDEHQVSLVNLGEMYLLSAEPYRSAITNTPQIESMTHRTIPQDELQIFIAFDDSFIATTQIQQVYIQVLDASGTPVQNASIGILVHFPDDTHQQYRPPCTDEKGMSTFSMMGFQERNLMVNDIIIVEATANSDQAEGLTSGWFRIWE